jgi:GNAT superfamily N-acetyltransferase
MIIRPAQEADIEALQAIEISASKAFLTVEGLSSFANDSCMSAEQHLSAIRPGTSWLAESANGDPAGFLAARREETALHIYEISVHLDHQKQGIGAALINRAEKEARALGLQELTLTTYRHVPWNAPFYQKHGFQVLAPEETDRRLAAILSEELGHGLPFPENRCAMRKILA